jgi:hypothetical protein
MNRGLLVLLLGVAGGFGAHVTYFNTHRPCVEPTLSCELTWIRDELDLSPDQYARLIELHQQTGPHLAALGDQLLQMRAELDAYEARRRGSNRVDFIEFGQFVKEQQAVESECETSSRSLILASAEMMEPEQRKRYLDLVGLENIRPSSRPL